MNLDPLDRQLVDCTLILNSLLILKLTVGCELDSHWSSWCWLTMILILALDCTYWLHTKHNANELSNNDVGAIWGSSHANYASEAGRSWHGIHWIRSVASISLILWRFGLWGFLPFHRWFTTSPLVTSFAFVSFYSRLLLIRVVDNPAKQRQKL